MNNVVSNFTQLETLARSYGVDLTNQRAILREYLQSLILYEMYSQPIAKNLYFIGGTALRILHNLNRFSEDLDFDYDSEKITEKEIVSLLESLVNELSFRNIHCELYKNKTSERSYYEFRFTKLLQQLELSPYDQEKLVIKFDFEPAWQGSRRELVTMNRYTFVKKISSLTIEQLFSKKLIAYLERSETMPRDIYDIVWFKSLGNSLDNKFLSSNGYDGQQLIEKVKQKYFEEEHKLDAYKRRLKPLLFSEGKLEMVDLLPELL